MNRSGQMVSGLLATLGTVRILIPALLAQLFALDKPVALFGIAVAVIAYGVWYGPLKFLAGSSITRFMGLIILVLGIASISSPTLLGLRGTYLPIADIFVMIEAGIVMQMIGLEQKQPETLSPLVALSVIFQLLSARIRPAIAENTAKIRNA
ncbi:MAG: hypothetical protein QFB87_04950 [Patescibacteria group bacterium]|nr:hypothetical protein [Patescibacteria group bacterium]